MNQKVFHPSPLSSNFSIKLKVPATTANLGSGFDTLGMALSLYNIFTIKEILPEGEYKCEISGENILLGDEGEDVMDSAPIRRCVGCPKNLYPVYKSNDLWCPTIKKQMSKPIGMKNCPYWNGDEIDG